MKEKSNQTNLKNAIVEIAKSLESVFKKYSRQTRAKAWEKITSKEGEKEVKKILNDPSRQTNTFQKLATQNESKEGVKVWLDDERPKPDEFDIHVRTAREAISLLKSEHVLLISLDHDLGNDSNGTGYDVAKFIEEGAFLGTVPPVVVKVHSANPVGSNRIKMCIENANRYWN